ncbi:hypothetical protein [Bauldia sp.]|uniref:hypothetical protein n=1 Tax=Bauldia sp. TaxID=2575872 RepID=UPI003BACBC46
MTLAITAVLTGTGAMAQDASVAPHCGTYEVITANRLAEVVDVAPEGVSVGDQRVGSHDLTAADGTVVGKSYWATKVADTSNGVHTLIGDANHVYENGTLHHNFIYQLPDPLKPEIPKDLQSFDYHVIGGTGEFAGAEGTAYYSSDSDGNRIIRLELDCGS